MKLSHKIFGVTFLTALDPDPVGPCAGSQKEQDLAEDAG